MSDITSDQVDTSPLSVQDSMLCSAGLHVGDPALAQTTENQRSNAATSASSRKRKLSSEDNSDDNKTALCASSKRKLEAYRSRPLEPKEGELVNENNEMFETILQSKLPESLID
jgi:hypothetical protein